MLFQNMRDGIGIACVMFLVFAAALIFAPGMPLGARVWIVAQLIWFAVGFALLFAYQRAQPKPEDTPRWARLAVAGGAVAGLLWGVPAFLLADPEVKPYETMIIAVLAMITVGAAPGYAVYLPMMVAFSGGVAVAAAAGIALIGDVQHLIIAVMILMMTGAVFQFGRKFNQSLKRQIALELSNAQLINALTLNKTELEVANEAKTRFLAAANHDLRQPMHALGLFAESLREWVSGQQGQKIYERMMGSVLALEELMDQLMSISKLDAGAIHATLRPTRIQRSFDTLKNAYMPLAQEKGLELNFVATKLMVNTDEVLLQRSLANLIANAIRYTEVGGVLVGCRRKGDEVRIDVIDTGCGIPHEKFDAVFDEFIQLNNPEHDRRKGFGLGLAIVKRIAGLLQARLALASVVGHGSRFSLYLPSHARTEVPAPPALPECNATAAQLAGLNILILDDELEVRTAMNTLLTSLGAHVLEADCCAQALRVLASPAPVPDIILADLRLRERENGIDAIQRIRAQQGRAIPAIIISGDTARARLEEVERAGFVFAHKPLAPAKLYELITQVVRQQPAPVGA